MKGSPKAIATRIAIGSFMPSSSATFPFLSRFRDRSRVRWDNLIAQMLNSFLLLNPSHPTPC